ncbi:hypothetical protein [Natrarchaeobaculum sulfurireducens]|uniref:Uncharacterized protein n=1 Tax=Natrarchaeobaculum sulfurireducens TaxID=2044521 RepID=A0A346PE66_9EURY|nr:hypothetical protein AArc1_1477 [Natrarchaeobaculum sulfurireducens]AXR82206.1 hypothetical protein AArcMg_2209 [Natrarchaeobaculum sulfurireducens]
MPELPAAAPDAASLEAAVAVAVPGVPAADPVAVAVVSVRLDPVDFCPVDVRRPVPVRPPVDRLVPPVSLVFVFLSFLSLERVRDCDPVPVDVVFLVFVVFVVLVRLEEPRPVEFDSEAESPPLVRFEDRLVFELLDDRDVPDDRVVLDDRVLPDELVAVVSSVFASFASDSSSVVQTLGDGIPLVRFET